MGISKEKFMELCLLYPKSYEKLKQKAFLRRKRIKKMKNDKDLKEKNYFKGKLNSLYGLKRSIQIDNKGGEKKKRRNIKCEQLYF